MFESVLAGPSLALGRSGAGAFLGVFAIGLVSFALFGKKLEEGSAEETAKPPFKGKKFESISDNGKKLLKALSDRYKDKEVTKSIKDAQDPAQGPYVNKKEISGIGWAPNYLAEPTVFHADVRRKVEEGQELDGFSPHSMSIARP